jgi:hypothetical protein
LQARSLEVASTPRHAGWEKERQIGASTPDIIEPDQIKRCDELEPLPWPGLTASEGGHGN